MFLGGLLPGERHPHLHLLVTDGGFRADGTFVPLPLHDVTTLTEAFRRAVLRLFVRRELMDVATTRGMLAWSHSGLPCMTGCGSRPTIASSPSGSKLRN